MSTEEYQNAVLERLDRLLVAVESIAKRSVEAVKAKTTDEERAALAFVAIQNGATTFTEIATELGISRRTAARNPGICRALKTMVVDRKVGKEEGEDFRWQA